MLATKICCSGVAFDGAKNMRKLKELMQDTNGFSWSRCSGHGTSAKLGKQNELAIKNAAHHVAHSILPPIFRPPWRFYHHAFIVISQMRRFPTTLDRRADSGRYKVLDATCRSLAQLPKAWPLF